MKSRFFYTKSKKNYMKDKYNTPRDTYCGNKHNTH